MNATVPLTAPATSDELAVEASPLAQALGSAAALASLTDLAKLVDAPHPDSLPAIRGFLARYRDRLMLPVELPAIRDAYEHARRGEARELVELDRRLAREFGDSAFAEASRHVGRIQLRRLRPMRDRTLQKYLRAVDSGDARGWHVVVFGLLLSLFSLPLRQGLVHYATKTQGSLLDSALLPSKLSAEDRRKLGDECDAPIAPAVHRLLPVFAPAVR